MAYYNFLGVEIPPARGVAAKALVGLVRGYQKYLSPLKICLLYTSPSPRDKRQSRMPSSA